MTDNDALESKIAKLLRLADNQGATEAEALSAMEKAQKLAHDHNIELAEISLTEKHEAIKFNVEEYKLNIEGSGVWRRILANQIAISYDGDCVWIKQGGTHSGKLHIFAPEGVIPSIVRTYEFIEKWILDTVDWEFKMSGTYVHGRTWKTSWIEGAVNRIIKRIQTNSEIAATECSSETALALIQEEVAKTKALTYSRLGSSGTRSINVHGDAYRRGQKAGANASLGGAQSITRGGQKALKG